MIDRFMAWLTIHGARALTGVQAQWFGCAPAEVQRVYFANHSSHFDFVLLWASLPPHVRRTTRPVAAADYWTRSPARRFFIHRVFRGVLVRRGSGPASENLPAPQLDANPLQPMLEALDKGSSLIIFPEGTRGDGETLQPFKPGIYHLARLRPQVELVPVWMDNSYRVMPKGSFLPVPLLCSVRFGAPTRLHEDEDRAAFLARLHHAVEELRIL